MMTRKEILDAIVKSFEEQYGFAPAKKNIRFMESSGCGEGSKELFDWVAFCIGRIGYCYRAFMQVERVECYDLKTE